MVCRGQKKTAANFRSGRNIIEISSLVFDLEIFEVLDFSRKLLKLGCYIKSLSSFEAEFFSLGIDVDGLFVDFGKCC